MRSWFRDEFYENLNNQKLGAFDPYMDEYVLGMNEKPVPTTSSNTSMWYVCY